MRMPKKVNMIEDYFFFTANLTKKKKKKGGGFANDFYI
jgi:hypothetical protein